MADELGRPSFDEVLSGAPYYLFGCAIFFVISTYLVHRRGWDTFSGAMFTIAWPMTCMIGTIVGLVYGVYLLARLGERVSLGVYTLTAKIWRAPTPTNDVPFESGDILDAELMVRLEKLGTEEARAEHSRQDPKVNVPSPKNPVAN